MDRMKGKVCIVTGAGQGLGAKIVEVLAREGAHVVGTGRHVEKVEAVAAELKEKGLEIIPMAHEITSKESWNEVVAKTVEKFGKVDVLVNNAAIMAMKGILECTEEEFLAVFKTNCMAVLFGIQAVAPEMEKVGGGSVVNIDSIGGLVSGDADGGDVAYSASKGGTRAMTKNAAFYLSGKGIRVNTIHPGGIMTPMLKSVYDATPALWDRVKETSPLAPHISGTEDIANGVLYLASDDARTVTGAELVIDCGYMMH